MLLFQVLTLFMVVQAGECIPQTLQKATTRVGKLQWLVRRIILSRLLDGISRASLHKVVLHFWECVGRHWCEQALKEILEDEGHRASGDHTYNAVSNLTAFDEQGKAHILKASLISVLGQGVVLGFKASVIFFLIFTVISPRAGLTPVYLM